MANASVGSVAMDLTLNSKNYTKQLNAVTKSTESAFSSTMKKVGGFIAGAFAVKQVVDFTKTCIDSASQVQAAFTGLNSIVEGTGNSFAQAQKFINEYTSDGLVSINEAATAYKNLLARGYDTSQIEDVLTRLKDSAAFGRQASYDLGEAVVTATEGLKNENSILVDNAGVTKNVAKMWEDYAKEIGVSTNDLTQAQKIQAEYNGIMEETRFQVGDAAAYTKTFSGQVQQLKFNFTQMTAAIGKVVAPIAQLFIPVLNAAMQAVTNLFQSMQNVLKAFGLDMPDVVSKTSSAVNGVSADIESTGDSAVSAAKKINKAFASVDEINVLKTSDSSSSGSDTSTGGTNAAISVTPASDDAVSTAVSTTVEKIRKYIEPLQNINFEPLINAFSNLKSAITPIIEDIGKVLGWIWLEIITPWITYLLEKWWPTLVDIFAGALKIVEPILEGFGEGFSIVWENVLKPILSWTYDGIVAILGGIADALNWIGENETASTILKAVGIALGVIVGAIATYNTVMGICNVVTGIFSGIMTVLTSPITLVVLAITALIAIIWLLIDNWDAVKEAASACWDWIVGVFQGAAEWFNTTIIQPITNFFTGMWEGLKNGASAAWEGVKNVFSTVAEFFKNIFTNAWEGVKSVFSTGGKIFDGIKDGIVKAFTTVVNAIIKGINKVVALPFDGLNKILNKISNLEILSIKPFSWLTWRAPVPQIPLLAQGGWFERGNPQLAVVGDNTREPEIVAPESKIYDQVRNAIRDSGGTGKQEIEITIYHKYEDGRTIIQKINQAQIDAGQVLVLS